MALETPPSPFIPGDRKFEHELADWLLRRRRKKNSVEGLMLRRVCRRNRGRWVALEETWGPQDRSEAGYSGSWLCLQFSLPPRGCHSDCEAENGGGASFLFSAS